MPSAKVHRVQTRSAAGWTTSGNSRKPSFEERKISIRKLAKKILRHWWAPRDIPIVTLTLTTLIVAVHTITQSMGWNETVRETLGLQPGKPLTYVTYAVLHGNTKHLLGNTIVLLLLGPILERSTGAKIYALAILGLITLGAAASTTLAQGHWTSGKNPVGLSTATAALITAEAYLLVEAFLLMLKTTRPTQRTVQNLWARAVISAFACAILVYGSFGVNAGPALVGHITAFLGGTAIALNDASLNTIGRNSRRKWTGPDRHGSPPSSSGADNP